MNRRPSRFRPCLEELEDRSLLSLSVTFRPTGPMTQGLSISPDGDTPHQVITIFNNGYGHITGGDESGSFNNGAGFFNVTDIDIFPAAVPGASISVYYFQQGDADNPSGDQHLRLNFRIFFGGGARTASTQT
jgi:hypothetical protein